MINYEFLVRSDLFILMVQTHVNYNCATQAQTELEREPAVHNNNNVICVTVKSCDFPPKTSFQAFP